MSGTELGYRPAWRTGLAGAPGARNLDGPPPRPPTLHLRCNAVLCIPACTPSLPLPLLLFPIPPSRTLPHRTPFRVTSFCASRPGLSKEAVADTVTAMLAASEKGPDAIRHILGPMRNAADSDKVGSRARFLFLYCSVSEALRLCLCLFPFLARSPPSLFPPLSVGLSVCPGFCAGLPLTACCLSVWSLASR
eukprot:3467970-Rhodomonas_salina.2